jgi:TolB protein
MPGTLANEAVFCYAEGELALLRWLGCCCLLKHMEQREDDMNCMSLARRTGIIACAVLISTSVWAQEWKEFVVSNRTHSEYSPSVSGRTVVWEVTSSFGDRDVRGADISDPNNPELFSVSAGAGDERYPVVSGGRVVWENKPFGLGDRDIMGMDLWHPQQASFTITATEENDRFPVVSGPNVVWTHWGQGRNNADIGWATIGSNASVIHHTPLGTSDDDEDPAISGNRVVWKQIRYQSGAVSLIGADISDPDNVRSFDVGLEVGSWQLPKLAGDWVVAIDRNENGTLWAKNLDDSLDPIRVADSEGKEIGGPAIAGRIVVWEDKRNGHWDIYGFDLTTQTEFPICTHDGDQEKPSIYTDPNESSYVVVWQDRRAGNADIYGAIMKGNAEPPEPACTSPPPWDINGDCQIDFLDFAILADHWLERIE